MSKKGSCTHKPLALWVLGTLCPAVRRPDGKLIILSVAEPRICNSNHTRALMECPGTVSPFIAHHHFSPEATETVPLRCSALLWVLESCPYVYNETAALLSKKRKFRKFSSMSTLLLASSVLHFQMIRGFILQNMLWIVEDNGYLG